MIPQAGVAASAPAVPPWALLLAGAPLVALLPRRAGHAVGVTLAAVCVPLVVGLPAGEHLATTLFGFDAVLLRVDPLSRVVALAFAVVAVANVLYAYGTGTGRRETATQVAYMGAGTGAVLAGDWLTLVVWWETMAAAATVLVWRSGERVVGYRYAVYHQAGGVLLIAGVLLHFTAAGTFLYGADAGVVAGPARLLAAVGVGVNVGMLGLHVWLVDSYPRTSVATSAVLCGFTTKVGVYTLARVVPGRSLAVAWMGAAMLAVGVTLAVLQTDTRRLLTYHVVSQVGYMVAGVGAATSTGLAGAGAHLLNNVLYKTLLFMIAGAVLLRTGAGSLKRLGGLGRSMPVAATAFAVAALAITGIPGFSGYVSKGLVVDGARKAGFDAVALVLVVGGVGTVVSFAKFGYYAFVRPGEGRAAPDGRSGPATVAAMAVLAVPCVAIGVAPGLLLDFLPGAAGFAVFSTSKLTETALVTVAGLLAFVLLRGPLARVPPVPDLDVLYHPAGAAIRDGTVAAVGTAFATLDRTGTAAVDRAATLVGGPDAGPGDDVRPIGTGLALLAVTAALALGALVLLG